MTDTHADTLLLQALEQAIAQQMPISFFATERDFDRYSVGIPYQVADGYVAMYSLEVDFSHDGYQLINLETLLRVELYTRENLDGNATYLAAREKFLKEEHLRFGSLVEALQTLANGQAVDILIGGDEMLTGVILEVSDGFVKMAEYDTHRMGLDGSISLMGESVTALSQVERVLWGRVEDAELWGKVKR